MFVDLWKESNAQFAKLGRFPAAVAQIESLLKNGRAIQAKATTLKIPTVT